MRWLSLLLLLILASGQDAAPQAPAQQPPPEPPAAQPAPAEPSVDDPRVHIQRAMEAHKRKDWLGFLEHMQMAAALAGDQPGVIYRLAMAHARLGNQPEALALIGRLSAMRIWYDLATEDFDALRSLPPFQEAAAAMRDLKLTRIGSALPAFTLAEKDLVTEGIAFDPQTGDFFVSSVHRRKIVRVSRKGRAQNLTSEAQDGLMSVLGIVVDAPRRTLWACSSGMKQTRGAAPEEIGRAAVHRYDLATGALSGRYPLGAAGAGHNCNDLTVSAGGDLYVSDAESGELLVMPAGGTELSVLVGAGSLRSPQGLALSPDQRQLYVSDYGRGLYRLDLASRALSELGHPEELLLFGVDGLVQARGSLIAIQNGIVPHRVIRLLLTPAGDAIASWKILEMNHPLFDEPTLAVMADDWLHVIANSQWGRFDASGKLATLDRLAEPAVIRIKIK